LKLVAKLEADPDWRAAAFLLERGYRERWGRSDQSQQAQPVIVLTAAQVEQIADGLRYVRDREATPALVVDATRADNGEADRGKGDPDKG
jgi:hypothetical protein